MNNDIKLYFQELFSKYDKDFVVLGEPVKDKSRLEGAPKVLHELYEIAEKVDLPFWFIFDVEEAKRRFQLEPFKPNYFVLGKDNYTSFLFVK